MEQAKSTTRYLSCAETAKLVRQALKAEFPGVKFSVRSSTYSGGASIDVRWADGPTHAQVRATTQLYAGATFDGMQDLKSYHRSLLAGPDGEVREVHFGADFIFESRDISDELRDYLVAHVSSDRRCKGPAQCAFCFGGADEGYVAGENFQRFACSEVHAAALDALVYDARPGAGFVA